MGHTTIRWTDSTRTEQRVELSRLPGKLGIGRFPEKTIRVDDPTVSRHHAELHCVDGGWTIIPTAPKNPTYVLPGGAKPEQLVKGRWLLRDRDKIRVGSTVLTFSDPPQSEDTDTVLPGTPGQVAPSAREIEVLQVLCAGMFSEPKRLATREEIAAELHISMGTLKNHFKSLYSKFDLPGEHSGKNWILAERAIEAHWVIAAEGSDS